MANPNASFGLRPVTRFGSHHGALNEYEIPSSEAAYYIGDAVLLATDSNSTDGTPLVNIGTTSSTLVGAVTSFKPVLTNLTLQYHLTTVVQRCLVADDPNQVFEIMSDGTLAHADIGKYAALAVGSGGSTVTGLSSHVLHEAGVTATPTSSLALMILKLANTPSNAFGANGVAEVLIINHAYRTGSGS